MGRNLYRIYLFSTQFSNYPLCVAINYCFLAYSEYSLSGFILSEKADQLVAS